MRAAGSAFTSAGISILLEVMVAGPGVAGPRRGLCGLCARSAARGRARLYIGRCQAGALLIGREGRGAGAGPSYLGRPRRSPDLHKPAARAALPGARSPRSSASGAPSARRREAAHAHAAVLDGGGANARRGRAALGGWTRDTQAALAAAGGARWRITGVGRGPRSLAGRGWEPSGRALTQPESGKSPGPGGPLPGRSGGPAKDRAATPQRTRKSPPTRVPGPSGLRLPFTLGGPGVVGMDRGALRYSPRSRGVRLSAAMPAHTHAPQRSLRFAVAAGSGTGSDECESFAPHSKRVPREPVDAARPSAGFSHPAAALCRPGQPRAVWAAPGVSRSWSSLLFGGECFICPPGLLRSLLPALTPKHTKVLVSLFCSSR